LLNERAISNDMQLRNHHGSVPRLSRGEFRLRGRSRLISDTTVRKYFQARLIILSPQPCVVGGSFIGKLRVGRKRRVMSEADFIRKDAAQDCCRRRRFEGSVKIRDKICRGKIDLVVRGIRAGGNRRRVCCPHCRRISASLPENPSFRSAEISGRSCGGSTACFTPRSKRNFIFSNPWSAAARGLETDDLCDIDAILP
jgi:hypothetical protein